ncbi:nitrophenyl compound nitroreductase subunit ArsF family protein [bacterium]|nr:nitrophenyl compound nitroreductase subunit ArsF family protein [bacterium]
MKPKMIVTVLLVAFVVVSVAVLIVKETRNAADTTGAEEAAANSPAQASNETGSGNPVAPDANVDVVYYFMTAQRCPSCMKIESFTRDAVQENFEDALKNHRLIWRMLAVDTPENNHFVKEYQLYTKSVVLVKIRKGKEVEWKNLEQVWNLLGDEKAFKSYITDEVRTFIEKG